MAIEQTDYRAAWSYRIAPDDPQQVQRKPNRPRAQWQDYARFADPYTAKAKLLRLGRDNTVEVER